MVLEFTYLWLIRDQIHREPSGFTGFNHVTNLLHIQRNIQNLE